MYGMVEFSCGCVGFISPIDPDKAIIFDACDLGRHGESSLCFNVREGFANKAHRKLNITEELEIIEILRRAICNGEKFRQMQELLK